MCMKMVIHYSTRKLLRKLISYEVCLCLLLYCITLNQGYRKQYLIGDKVSMHDDVIDLWAWHCIYNGIATPGLARALAQATGHYSQSNTCKNTITGM